MAQERLWFGCELVALAPFGSTSYTYVHGVQSCGMNTRFNLEQIFELGQAEVYEDSERQPDIEITMEKVLDGYPPIWHLATRGAVTGTLMGRSNQRCMVGVSLFSDTVDSASGTPIRQVQGSGMWYSSLNVNMPVNGPFTESATFVGNDMRWGVNGSLFTTPTNSNNDTPYAIAGSGGVQMREDFLIGEGAGGVTLLPTDIEGVTSSGTIAMTNGTPSVYLQGVRISSNFGRDAIYSLGKRGACYRYMQVPTTVETQIDVHSKQGHLKNAFEETDNLTEQRIYIKLREGSIFDLGTKNKLMSVGFNLGPAGGGGTQNASCSYNYRCFNKLTWFHPQDPSGL